MREKSIKTKKSPISKLQYGDPPFKRFKNSPALPIGLILFIASISLLIWNETVSFRAEKHLLEGLRLVVPVSNEKAEEENDGKLIYVTGTATTDETVEDELFGISEKALMLRRTVEMFQWEETKSEGNNDSNEQEDTFSYQRVWSPEVISSAGFSESKSHHNPGHMPYEGKTITASHVTIGDFTLSDSLVKKMKNFEPFPADSLYIPRFPAEIKKRVQIHEGAYYVSSDPIDPDIGDLKIYFHIVKPSQVSIIAKQSGKTLVPYGTGKNENIELLEPGVVKAEDMFKKAISEHKTRATVLRIFCFFLMCFAFLALFEPISILGEINPFIASMVKGGMGIFAVPSAMSLWTVTMGFIWLFHSPLFSIFLFLISVGIFFTFICFIRKK
ncbi:MAG: TMEM43 family protein [Candidatus Eremiobacterota bacterium]